jgi:hypothetical protein
MFADSMGSSRFTAGGAVGGLDAFVAVMSLTLTSFHLGSFSLGHSHSKYLLLIG